MLSCGGFIACDGKEGADAEEVEDLLDIGMDGVEDHAALVFFEMMVGVDEPADGGGVVVGDEREGDGLCLSFVHYCPEVGHEQYIAAPLETAPQRTLADIG